MKQFACGDIVPGCTQQYRLETEEQILAAVARHAQEVHGLESIPDEMVEQVRALIITIEE